MNFFLKAFMQQDASLRIRRGTLVLQSVNGSRCELETPGCFLYTQKGSIPHLTPDDLQYIRNLPTPTPLNLSLATMAGLADSVQAFGKPLGQYIGHSGAFIYMSLCDVLNPSRPGSTDRNSLGLWSRAGKTKITVDSFTQMLSQLQPDLIQVMADFDTELGSASGRRLNKSYENSLQWLDRCLEQKKLVGNDIPVLATVGGGSDSWKRMHFCSEMSSRAVDGFVVDGFGSEWLSSFRKWEKQGNIFDPHDGLVRESINSLPASKPRFVNAPLPPSAVIELVEHGVDVFDSSYPSALADTGEALLRVDNNQFSTINLSDKIFFDDLTTLSKDCTCYTCTKYTKAYLHHLVVCNEINAHVLLMIHNLNVYLEFFKDLRESIQNCTFSSWRRLPPFLSDSASEQK